MTEILETVYAHGFKNLVLFNSHGGNQAAGQIVIENLGHLYPDAQVTLLTWWRIVDKALFEINESGPGGVGHAGEFETSLVQWIAEELVDESEIGKAQIAQTFDWAKSDLLRSAKAVVYRSMKEMTANGVNGDPTFASKEKGKKLSL